MINVISKLLLIGVLIIILLAIVFMFLFVYIAYKEVKKKIKR